MLVAAAARRPVPSRASAHSMRGAGEVSVYVNSSGCRILYTFSHCPPSSVSISCVTVSARPSHPYGLRRRGCENSRQRWDCTVTLPLLLVQQRGPGLVCGISGGSVTREWGIGLDVMSLDVGDTEDARAQTLGWKSRSLSKFVCREIKTKLLTQSRAGAEDTTVGRG